MISFIICSINNDYLNRLITSIKDTVQIDFELLVIDNKKEQLSISEAYNKCARNAKFQYLVFVHEDVEFLNFNWGLSLINILDNKKVGIVGVAGSTYLPSVPSGWYLPIEDFNKVYIHQGFKYIAKPVRIDDQGDDLTSVFLVDGVFLAMRKDVFHQFPFNEQIVGFHAYDVDICQRISTKYCNVFTKQIQILHHSEGKVNQSYFDALLQFKMGFLNFSYKKRDFSLEFSLLKQFYYHLRCYYDKRICVKKIRPFIKIKYLGWKGYFSFLEMLRNE